MSLGEYYNKKPVYRKMSGGRVRGILKLLGPLQGQKILDIGCGAGELGRKLKRDSSVVVHGIDISADAVRDAGDALDFVAVYDIAGENPVPEFLEKEQYSAAVLSEVLEHLFEPAQALIRVREVFHCPVVITVPNVLFWKNRLRILFGSFEYTNTGLMDKGHIHFFSWKSLQETVKEAGYTIEATAHHVPTRGTRFLSRWFPNLLAYQFIIKIKPIA